MIANCGLRIAGFGFPPAPRGGRAGVALIVVLWISALLTLLVTTLLRSTLVEYSLASSFEKEKQAEALALSGIDKGIAFLTEDETPEATLLEEWADNDTEFLQVRFDEGFFSLVRPTYDDTDPFLFGLIDEASKVNVSFATKDMLMGLPNVTEEIAESILDWVDEDDEPQPMGAESSYYATQDRGYPCKNAPFETIEELLYVRGMTAEILWGDDKNRNGVQDKFEDADGEFDAGLAAYITVWSYENNTANDGQPRVDLNTSDQNQLQQRLGQEISSQAIMAILLFRVTNQGYKSVGDLLGVPGLSKDDFKKIVDLCTIAGNVEQIPGLININTAPKKVLLAIPEMTEEMAGKIIGQRTQEGLELSNIGWLVDVLSNEEIRKIANFLTTRSYQFRFDSVGVVAPKEGVEIKSTPFRRFMAVYDKLKDPPGLVYWKDWSKFGLPYDVNEVNE